MWKTAGVSGSMSPICLGRFITTSVTDIVTESVLPVKGKRGFHGLLLVAQGLRNPSWPLAHRNVNFW